MKKPLVAVISLGCPKARVDAEIILGHLLEQGFEITGDAGQAQAVVVNTCGFLEEAIEESAQVIERHQARRRTGEIRSLLVTGCLPQRGTDDLCGRFPWVDAFVGLDAIPDIPRIIGESRRFGEVYVLPRTSWNPGTSHPRFVSTPPHYAYLRLTEGCSNRCSYCAIPVIRGDLRLRDADDVLNEAKDLAGIGAKELILIAQDTTAHPELERIFDGLEKINDLKWIRLLYAHPAHLSERIVERMAGSKKILSYVDMPVQHLADSVLERMKRKVRYGEIERLVTRARELDPDFSLRTTVMVGFPGETDEEFQTLVERLEYLRFTHLGVFVYSAEEGTEAYTMAGRVPIEKARERANMVIELAERIQAEETKRLEGRKEDAVIDFSTPDGVIGRLWSSAPEIDRIVEIEGAEDCAPGTFGKVEIIGGKDDIITARWIKSF